MPVYEESGLRVTLPDGASFRIQDLQTYNQLKGRKLREMDFCWFNKNSNQINLLEIKDYSYYDLPEHLVDVLQDKTVDTLLLLCAELAFLYTFLLQNEKTE